MDIINKSFLVICDAQWRLLTSIVSIMILGGISKTSWLPNQMISLIFIFGFLCRSSSWRLWTHIGWGRLFRPLLRPQMIVFDQFFCKICFFMGMTKEGFFWGVMSVIFWAVGTVFQKWGGFSKKEGGFYALEYFSNMMLRDMLTVKYKDKKQIDVRVLFGKSCCH